MHYSGFGVCYTGVCIIVGSGFVILSVHYSGFGVCYTGVCIIVGSGVCYTECAL